MKLDIIPITKKFYTQPYVATGTIIEKDNKFLMVQEGVSDIGTWNRPGGWLDVNEDILDGAKREVWEETGLEIKLKGFLGVYSYFKEEDEKIIHGVLLEFIGKLKSDKIKVQTDEIQKAKWFTLDELKKLPLRRPQIITEVEDYLKGQSYPLEIIKKWQNFT